MNAESRPLSIVFLDRETLPDNVRLRSPKKNCEWKNFSRTSACDVKQRIADADIVVTNKVKLDKVSIQSAKKLKHIAIAATGADVVDLLAAQENNIVVSNIRNYAVNTVPEHTFALILALRRSIFAFHRSIADGRWQEADQFCYFDYPIRDLSGSTLGIVGDGVLGKAVAEIARGFGMNVLFSAYKGTTGMGPLYTPFEQVLELSDIITLHLPLLSTTHNIIGSDEFEQMKRNPLLINTARGGLVDEPALVDALERKLIAGAAFDVVTQEPPSPDHPFMRLLGRPNFILTPHIAWASLEAIQGLADQLIDNIDAYIDGEPRNIVTIEKSTA